MEQQEQAITLKYDGGFQAGEGEMNALEAAEAIRGFTDFTRRAVEALYGEGAEVRAMVRGVKHGSLDIPFLIKFAGEGAALLASTGLSPQDLLKLIAESIKLMKSLGGKPPTSIKTADNGSMIVESNNGTINHVGQMTVNLVLSPEAGRDLQKFVRRPLAGGAADLLKILADETEIANVNREEAPSFVPIDAGNVVAENTNEVYLTIATAVLVGKTQWKFYDGRNTFSAVIEDREFLSRVDAGEVRFGKGDTLFVRLRTTQKKVGTKLKAEYVIEEVLDHRWNQKKQGSLF
ncbi:hypothetical protein [Azospirillum sp. sgz301742]